MAFLRLVVIACLVLCVAPYYVPGTYPREFAQGEAIEGYAACPSVKITCLLLTLFLVVHSTSEFVVIIGDRVAF